MIAYSIITPCSRPDNLIRISASIPADAQWIIVLDCECADAVEGSIARRPLTEIYSCPGREAVGSVQRNHGLRRATGRYVYFLDDDNIVHERLFTSIEPLLDGERIVVVNQVWPDGERRITARPPVRVGGIDTAQVLLPTVIARELEFPAVGRAVDGKYFSAIWERHATKFVFVHDDLCYYNYLRPRTPPAEMDPPMVPGPRAADVNGRLLAISASLEVMRDEFTLDELRYLQRFAADEIALRRHWTSV